MYADDLPIYAIYATIDNKEDYIKLLYELHELCKWASDKCLSINYNKCKVINFRPTNKNLFFKLITHYQRLQMLKKYQVELLNLIWTLANRFIHVVKRVSTFLIKFLPILSIMIVIHLSMYINAMLDLYLNIKVSLILRLINI